MGLPSAGLKPSARNAMTPEQQAPMVVEAVDPFTVEVVRAALREVAEEMKVTIIRTAHGFILSVTRDFGCSVFDENGALVGEAIGVPLFEGTLGYAVEAIMREYPWEKLHEGDIFLHNDPYDGGGTHLNDVCVIAPVFFDSEPAGFVAVKAHWNDIGASIPGTGPMTSTDFHEEGIRFHAVKLYEAGVPNEPVLRLITRNVRIATGVMHDVDAIIAACRVGVARYGEVFAKYDAMTVREARTKFVNQSEVRMRRAIAEIPDGDYSAESFLDNDGVTLDEPVHVAVSVKVRGSELTIDLSESSAQRGGPCNCGSAIALSTCKLVLKCVTRLDDPGDEGEFRPLTVILPPGLVLSAQEPAPVGKYGLVAMLLFETTLRALADALPDRIPAGGHGDNIAHPMFGRNPQTNRFFMMAETHPGGTGAYPDGNGESAMCILAATNLRNIPVEMVEARHPYVHVERYELRPDSGGAGRYRGGLGCVREWRFFSNVEATFFAERTIAPPWGLHGGEEGGSNRIVVTSPDGRERQFRKGTLSIRSGEVLSVATGGGGGYGDPSARPVEDVEEDMLEGYVTPRGAVAYQVVVDAAGRVDEKATRHLRAARSGQ